MFNPLETSYISWYCSWLFHLNGVWLVFTNQSTIISAIQKRPVNPPIWKQCMIIMTITTILLTFVYKHCDFFFPWLWTVFLGWRKGADSKQLAMLCWWQPHVYYLWCICWLHRKGWPTLSELPWVHSREFPQWWITYIIICFWMACDPVQTPRKGKNQALWWSTYNSFPQCLAICF